MEPWKLRLETIKDKLQHSIQELEKAAGGSTHAACGSIKSLNSLFIAETRACIDKLTEEDIVNYTKLQMDAQVLTIVPESVPLTLVQHQNRSKLPELELCKFDGDILNWCEFWDRFSSSVDKRNISNADKLSYLQSSLEQEALSVIQGLKTTNENYPVAVGLLKGRFGKPILIIDAHYEALFKIRKASNTAKECMDTFNDIERHLRILEAMGEDIKHNNLRTMIMSKFPDDVIYELKTKLKPETDSVEDIRKLLENLLTARMTSWKPCTTEVLHIRETNNHKKLTLRPRQRNTNWKVPGISFPSTSSSRENTHKRKNSFMCAPVEKKKRRILPCIFCSQDHFNDHCDLNLMERKKRLGGRCFICFKEGHAARNCQSKIKCYHCKARHNSSLCPKKKDREQEKTDGISTIQCLGKSSSTFLQTAIVKIQKGETIWKCRTILDTGSQKSYITSAMAEKMNLNPIEQSFLTVFTFGSNKPISVESPVAEIEILGETSAKNIMVNVMPYITEDVGYPSKSLLNYIPLQYKTQLADDGSFGTTIDLLIGNDYYYTFVKPEHIQCGEHLYLVRSEFGWIWSGTTDHQEKECLSVITYVQDQPIQVTDSVYDRPLRLSSVHKLWDLETIGITDCPKATRDDQAVEQFNKTVKFENDRYWVKWPWYEVPPELPVNFGMAYGRLTGLLKRTDSATLEKYDAVLQDQLAKSIIEIIDNAEEPKNSVHYLPHHGVPKGDTVRLVYDASSKSKGNKSLNECLYRGPSLLESLIGLIIRFRTHKYGVLADVEKAFLQIGIQEEDRDVTRFLWLKDIHKKLSEENLLHLRFCRVPFGIGCSPFLLAITLKHHLRTVNKPVCNKVARDIYVDNLVSGGDCGNECLQLYQETIEAFKAISMNMREWYTNNKELEEAIDENRKGKEVDQTSVLGVYWSKKRDTLKLKFVSEPNTSSVTKRQVLSHLSAVYDPCGYATPLLIAPKLFLQDLWKSKLDWDVTLPDHFQTEWTTIVEQMKELKSFEIPRWYGLNKPLNDKESSVELHCFTDSSVNVYAAAVYIRVTENNESKISLVMSKSRLKPVKENSKNTIPRMELLGVLIGCRLMKYVHNCLDVVIKRQFLWTDSQIVLHWLETKKILPPFVAARVAEIKKSGDTEFRYVPTNSNPADIATRPCKEPLLETIWYNGPNYLKNDCREWPQTQIEHTMLTNTETNELGIITKIQQENFTEELKGKVTNLAKTLGLFKDNGILRCKGRFKMTEWPVDQKYPILLPKDNDFTVRIIEDIHKKLYHVGVSQTLANIRLKFWIPHGRSQVQKVLRKCQICKKYGGGPYKLPPVAPLPRERVNFSPPFTYTGTDYLGPLYVVTAKGSFEKRWICLFTCLAVRAVHLEVVANLSAEECVLALRRFISTRGAPSKILSDNAANFKLTADVLNGEYCVQNKILWRFIPDLAPWFGGVYERIVALIKHCFKRTIDKHTLNDSQLTTVTKEIEAVLNVRPLTTVGSDVEQVLTPADFLRVGGLLTQETSEKELTGPSTDIKRSLIEGWKKGLIILEEFKKMFISQYLTTLRERYSSAREPRVRHERPPRIGDVVQIKDDGPRVKWKVGKVFQLIESADKEIRVAKVKIGEKEYKRAIGQLYPLEIYEPNPEENKNCNTDTEENEEKSKEDIERTELEKERQHEVINDEEDRMVEVEDETESQRRTEVTDITEKEQDGQITEKVRDAQIENQSSNKSEKDTQRKKDEEGHGRGTRRAAEEARRKMSEWTKLLLIQNEYRL